MDIRETKPLKPTVYMEIDGEEVEVELPTKWKVCPACEGEGKTVNPSIDRNGISMDEFYDDPDFAEDYFGGVYDVTCYHCGGKRVVKDVDYDACTKEELDAWDAELTAELECRAEAEAEMRYCYGLNY